MKILSSFWENSKKKGNMTNSWKSYQVSEKIAMKKGKMTNSWRFCRFSQKAAMKKGKHGNKLYIFQPILVSTTLSCSAICPALDCKILGRSDEASIIYGGWLIHGNPINSLKKVNLEITYIFQSILISATLSRSATCLLVKWKNCERSDKASITCSACNMSNSWKSYQFSEKMAMKKKEGWKEILHLPTDFNSDNAVM